ncbi:MAG: 3-dehydroquinate synthase [Polyangiaceae bacterium]
MLPARHLVLSGFMATGKTTVGRALASRWSVPFVDTDDLVIGAAHSVIAGPRVTETASPTASAGAHTASAGAHAGTAGAHAGTAGARDATIAILFERLGEPAFRRLEAEALARALASPRPSVIAVGGGALVDPANRARALAAARVVTLVASPRALLARLDRPGAPRRPLLEGDPATRRARLEALLESRAAAYAEAHAQIRTDDGDDDDPAAIEAVADAVERSFRAPGLVVPLGAASYPVRFAGAAGAGAIVRDLLSALRPSSWFHVTDTNVAPLWRAPFLRAAASTFPPLAKIALPPGEREKHLAAIEPILHAFVEAGADRSSLVVAHGGGVVSDMTGFTAAILLRGVRWISVPTTLLSMADAAIGGKTGVDLGLAKNAIGAFHQPSAVVIDVRHTTTEPARAFTSGLAEIAKSGAIADTSLIALLETAAAKPGTPSGARSVGTPSGAHSVGTPSGALRDLDLLEPAVFAAAAVKARIVAQDPRESGVRALLNFGHTLGHALEAAGGFERWTHGEAVSLGMIGALRAGVALGLTPRADADRLTALLAALGLPVDLRRPEVEAALPFLSLDKKRRSGTIRAVFLASLGEAVLHELPIEELADLYLRTS